MIFSHGASVGDIDGDGDMDIIVTSINWRNNNTSRENGEIFCYVNQGDGHKMLSLKAVLPNEKQIQENILVWIFVIWYDH